MKPLKKKTFFSVNYGALVLSFLISVVIANLIAAPFVLAGVFLGKLPSLSATLSVIGCILGILGWALSFKRFYKYFESES